MKQKIFIILFLVCNLNMHARGAEYVIAEVVKQVVKSVGNEKTFEPKGPEITSDKSTMRTTSSVEKKNPALNSEKKHKTLNKNATSHETEQQDATKKHTSFINEGDEFALSLYNFEWKFLFLKILKIIFIIFCAWFLWDVSNRMAQGYIKKISLFKKVSSHTSTSTQALIRTISPIIRSVFHWVLVILTTLMVLSELNVNITPIFFSLGVVGIAFTIGSQTLMKDIVNGILMLFEGNVAVGDVVIIGTRTGTVESLSLRALLLRHFTGELQTIPLSEVTALINCSRDFSVANVQFVVDPKALIPDIEKACLETFSEMKKDTIFGAYITGDLGRLGIKQMSEIGVSMSLSIPTIPDPKKRFVAEFNKRLYQCLQSYNVPLAYNGTASAV